MLAVILFYATRFLADEVGLGKTIEAGLVISQRWAERRRLILIIVFANLRNQWHQELLDKFGLQGYSRNTRSQMLFTIEWALI